MTTVIVKIVNQQAVGHIDLHRNGVGKNRNDGLCSDRDCGAAGSYSYSRADNAMV